MVVYTVSVGPGEAWDLLVRPRVLQLLGNTVALVGLGMAVTVVLGVGCAWLVERTDLPGRRWWHGVLVAPLAVPAFVNSFGWVSLTHAVQSLPGAVMVVSLSYFPLVYLPVTAMLRGTDPAMEEVALALEPSRLRVATRIVLPALRPAILGGTLLVGLHLLAEFGALQMLQFQTFTTAIYDQYRSAFNGPAANMLASVLVLASMVLLLVELRWRGHTRYARTGTGAARTTVPHRLGRWRIPTVLGLTVLVAMALGVPLASLVRWMIVGSSTTFPVGEIAEAVGTTVGLGLAAGAVATALALPVAWLAVRHRSPATTVLERVTYLPTALPGIVVALAFITISIRYLEPLYQTVVILVAAYAVLFLPRAVVSVRSAVEQVPPVLEDVGRTLGQHPLRVLLRIRLPLILHGLGASLALVFIAVSTELTATLLLAPIGTTTLSTRFWAEASTLSYGAAAPYGLLLVLISIPATVWLSRRANPEVVA